MAGIGFRLQKILSHDTLTATLQAYAYSALIAAGPFLLTVLVVSFIHWVSLETLRPAEQAYFQALVTYGFAFSLLAVGPSYLVVTRYVADEYYRGHTTHFTAVFFSSFNWNALIWGPWALAYFAQLSVSWTIKLNAMLLFFLISGIWLSLVFLSAAKNYWGVLRAFLFGSALSLACSAWWGLRWGLEGYFSGFVCGQGISFLILSICVLKEFGYKEPRDTYWLYYFIRHPRLLLIGFCYNVGIWADKFLFWISQEGQALDTWFRHCPIYDTPLFFAYLTVVPSLAYFLFRMETDFFLRYQSYYQAIQDQEPLSALEKRRVEIVESLTYSLKRLVTIQGIFSGLALLAVPWITQLARMDPIQMGIFRIAIFASFLQVGFLILLNLLLYFDLQKDALWSAGLFCGANAVLTFLSLRFGLPAYGYGYTCACLLSLGFTFYLLNSRLSLLHYWTFMKQPIPRLLPVSEEDA